MAEYSLEATTENIIDGALSPKKKPILIIKSGDVVNIETISKLGIKGGFSDYMTKYNIPADNTTNKILAAEKLTAIYPNGHVLTGPIAVEDAQPGDVLEVEILETKLSTSYANAMTEPGFGGLPNLTTEQVSIRAEVNAEGSEAFFLGTRIPLAPFFGIVGNAPEKNCPSGPPNAFGGNLDCKELTAGSKVFLPVAVPGGLFYTGDGHAAQGDGEISLDALETSLNGKFRFTLHKKSPYKFVRAETKTAYLFFGLDEDLNLAMEKAEKAAVDFIAQKKKLDFHQALLLASIITDFRVTQVVDGVKGIHAVLKKSYFA